MTVTVSLETWLAARRDAVDAALERFLPHATTGPVRLAEAMRYSLFAGGKRLRPMLTLAAAEAVGVRTGLSPADAHDLALPAACALELIHTYSLVHDDLPAMDNDVLRRGRPTAHVVFGEGMAILAGDALLTDAFALLAREPGSEIPAHGVPEPELAARKLRTIEAIGLAAGAGGMAGGQALDLEATDRGAILSEVELADMHARKTGALLGASAVAGAVMAGGSAAVIAAIADYGAHVGLAFQIVDDILDVEGASAVLGKTAGKDAAAGKPTYPARYGLEDSRRRAAASVGRALDALVPLELEEGQLPAIARWVVARRH